MSHAYHSEETKQANKQSKWDCGSYFVYSYFSEYKHTHSHIMFYIFFIHKFSTKVTDWHFEIMNGWGKKLRLTQL